MKRYVCIIPYISLDGHIEFKEGDIHKAEFYGNRYTIERVNGFICIMKEESFFRHFKKVFTFGR